MLLAACFLLQALAPEALRRAHLLAIRAVPVRPRGLDARRQVLEARVRQEYPQALAAELALAQVRVVVALGAEGDLRVVHVHADEALGAHLRVVLLHHQGERLGRRDVETGREQVAAVDAGPEPLAAARGVDQLSELVEVLAQRPVGPRSVLEQDRAPLGALERLADQLPCPLDGRRVRLALPRAGVEHDARGTDPVAYA